MFWDNVAGVYDVFANLINRKTHIVLLKKISELIEPTDVVLECACGTGLITKAVAPHCKHIVATDFSEKMLEKAKKKCEGYPNVEIKKADIMCLDFPDERFDKVIAGNVIHLLDEPYKALSELQRVCKNEGKIIIPTYMNRDSKENTGGFSTAAGKAGADFKRQFNFASYIRFFEDEGYLNGKYTFIEGRVPCALAVVDANSNS